MAAPRAFPAPALWCCLSILLLDAAVCSGARVGLSRTRGGEGQGWLGGEMAHRRLASGFLSKMDGAGTTDPLSKVFFSVTPHDGLRMTRKLRQAPEDDQNEMLLAAAASGDTDEVTRLIEDGADVGTTNADGNTPLILATAGGTIDVLRVLLDAGADIDQQGDFGATALRVAVLLPAENETILELLLAEGADTEISDDDGATPLFAAVVRENLAFVQILLRNGANPNVVYPRNGYTPLMVSAQLDTAVIMTELLNAEATVNATTPIGTTALHIASAFGSAEMANLLLDAGADIEAKAFDRGHTALLYAARFGNMGTFDVLVARGADLTVASSGGLNALHNAALAPNNTFIMETILANGADVNATSEDGQTAINFAAWMGDKPNVEFLFSRGADPVLNGIAVCGCLDVDGEARCPLDNCQTREDITEIHEILGIEDGIENLLQAVIAGDEEAVVRFIDDGADVEQSTSGGDTPLILASARGHEDIVTILLEEGADVNATDNVGLTPLIAASFFGHPSIVEILLAADAQIDAGLDGGVTSLHAAAQRGHVEVIQLLMDAGADLDAKTFLTESTPLAFAAEGNQLEAVRALIDGGADPLVRSADNLTALHLAATSLGSERIMNVLLDEGIDVNARAVANITPVAFAAYYGNRGGVLFLISRGADTQIDGAAKEVCGCLRAVGSTTLRQCPQGACEAQEQIDEIEELMGGDVPEAPISTPGSSAPGLPPNVTNMTALAEDVQDCSSLPSVVAQLECVSAATADPT